MAGRAVVRVGTSLSAIVRHRRVALDAVPRHATKYTMRLLPLLLLLLLLVQLQQLIHLVAASLGWTRQQQQHTRPILYII